MSLNVPFRDLQFDQLRTLEVIRLGVRCLALSCACFAFAQVSAAASAAGAGESADQPIRLAPLTVEAPEDEREKILSLAEVDTGPQLKESQTFPPTVLLEEKLGAIVSVTVVVGVNGRPTRVQAVAASVYDYREPKALAIAWPFVEDLARRGVIRRAGLELTIEEVRAGIAYEFGLAAEASVRNWRFEPARRNGQPVAVRIRVPIYFLPLAGKWEAVSQPLR